MSYKYELRATNNQGACVSIKADTLKDCLNIFDSRYVRKGFIISIFSNEDGFLKQKIKQTFR